MMLSHSKENIDYLENRVSQLGTNEVDYHTPLVSLHKGVLGYIPNGT